MFSTFSDSYLYYQVKSPVYKCILIFKKLKKRYRPSLYFIRHRNLGYGTAPISPGTFLVSLLIWLKRSIQEERRECVNHRPVFIIVCIVWRLTEEKEKAVWHLTDMIIDKRHDSLPDIFHFRKKARSMSWFCSDDQYYITSSLRSYLWESVVGIGPFHFHNKVMNRASTFRTSLLLRWLAEFHHISRLRASYQNQSHHQPGRFKVMSQFTAREGGQRQWLLWLDLQTLAHDATNLLSLQQVKQKKTSCEMKIPETNCGFQGHKWNPPPLFINI